MCNFKDNVKHLSDTNPGFERFCFAHIRAMLIAVFVRLFILHVT